MATATADYEIVNAGSLRNVPHSGIIYGPPGGGKTTLICTMMNVPGYGKGLLIDIDGTGQAISEDYPKIKVAKFKKRGDINAFQRLWDKLVASDGAGMDWIGIDTMTVLQQWKLRSLPKSDGHKRWGDVGDWAIDVANQAHDMSPMVWFAYHASVTSTMKGADKESTYMRVAPMLQGNATRTILGVPDIIGYLDQIEHPNDPDTYIHGLTLRPTPETATKNRFRRLPAIMGNPTMPKIYDRMQASDKKKKAKK